MQFSWLKFRRESVLPSFKKRVKVGSRVKAPCGHRGVVVWISGDGKAVAVKCLETKKHVRVSEAFGKRKKSYFNPVYLLDSEEFNVDKTIVFTGGFFHILHRGHINLFREAKRLGDYLIVCIHRDECVKRKRGICAVPLEDRKAVLQSIRYIDEIWVCSENCDLTQVAELEKLRKGLKLGVVLMPSSTPFILQDVPADGGTPLRNLAPEIAFGDAYFRSRPEGDVEACNSVSIRFITTSDAFEVDIASPVLLTDMPTPWAGLACVTGGNLFHEYSLSFSYTLQGVPKECVGYAVNFLSALLAPLTSMLSKVSESFDSYVSVELFSQLNDFVGYLPHSCSNVVSLFSTKFPKLETSFAGALVSITLKFCSPLFKHELFYGDILSEIGLLQHFPFTNDGYGDFGTVNVHAHPVWSVRGFWKVFREDDEEPEVSFHDDACYLPTIFEVVLKPPIGTILTYWKPYSFMVKSKAEDWISPLSLPEAEKPLVKPHDTFVDVFFHSSPYAPSVACSLYDKLGRHTVFASELLICLVMKLSPRLNVADEAESFLHNIEEAFISLLKHPSLSLSRLKKVKRQTFPRRRPRKRDKRIYIKMLWSQFLPRLKFVGFLVTIW